MHGYGKFWLKRINVAHAREVYTFVLPVDNLSQELIRSGLTLGVSLVTLTFGWLVGQSLTYRWNVRQKQREIQLSLSQAFYSAYGEFFAVWKLWNRRDEKSTFAEERQWELLKRAAAAEATIEAMLVKVAAERDLKGDQLNRMLKK